MSISAQVKALEDSIVKLKAELSLERRKGYNDALNIFRVKTKWSVDAIADLLKSKGIDGWKAQEYSGEIWAAYHVQLIEEVKV